MTPQIDKDGDEQESATEMKISKRRIANLSELSLT